jgi:membrane-bound lytic murein transglycosylase D
MPVEDLRDDHVRTRRPTYTVRSGDSLWKLARKFEVSEKELRVWNQLGRKPVIRPGQTLIVSANGSKKTAPAKMAKRQDRASRKITYRVRPGDTLWGISRQYDVAAAQIRTWNNLESDHILRPGDKLTLLVRDDGRRG